MDRKTYPLPTLAGMNIRKNRENVGDGFVYVCLKCSPKSLIDHHFPSKNGHFEVPHFQTDPENRIFVR